jgi:hypothetical protein
MKGATEKINPPRHLSDGHGRRAAAARTIHRMSDIARGHGGSGLAIAVALALGPALATGFARFAYGLLVPAMQADLGWTNTEAGLAGSANAFGYLPPSKSSRPARTASAACRQRPSMRATNSARCSSPYCCSP